MHLSSADCTIQEFAGRDNPSLDVSPEQEAEARCEGACPHVDRNDARCGHRFSLGRLDQAFNVCFGAFHACPLFQQLSGEVAIDEQRPQRLVEIRVIGALADHGRRLAGLRQTGS